MEKGEGVVVVVVGWWEEWGPVLAPMHVPFCSAAVAGFAVCLFTRRNPSSVAPFAFAPLSATSLGHTFALCTSAVTVGCHGVGNSE